MYIYYFMSFTIDYYVKITVKLNTGKLEYKHKCTCIHFHSCNYLKIIQGLFGNTEQKKFEIFIIFEEIRNKKSLKCWL